MSAPPTNREDARQVCRRHRWKCVTWTYEPSLADRMAAHALGLTSGTQPTLDVVKQLFSKQLLVTYRCADCGTEEVRRA
jgi:hypothetical protein